MYLFFDTETTGLPKNWKAPITYFNNWPRLVQLAFLSFDEKIIGAEFLRLKMENFLSGKKKICTMEQSTTFCKLNGPYGFKWPKLSELYFKLFNSSFEESHNA